MRTLVTTSRMPFAVAEIRKLSDAGHIVLAADTFPQAPGSHVRGVTRRFVVPSPTSETPAFLDALEAIITEHNVDLLLPIFEEVFYIASQLERFSAHCHVFAPPFETLAKLHDKVRFMRLAESLGLQVPPTIVATDQAALAAGAKEIGCFIARPAYSRGGVDLLTNQGPLAGEIDLKDCHPTAENPWLVQRFIRGTEHCSFTVAHHGVVAAHATYVHPRQVEHAGGIVFDSVEIPETLAIAERVVEATGYHGQISLDFIATGDAFVLIECNPRATAGVTVMPDDMFVRAVLRGPGPAPEVAPAGVRRKIAVALVRDMLHHPSELPADLAALASHGEDVYTEGGDIIPLLYAFLSYAHVKTFRKSLDAGRHRRTDLMAAYFHDVCWNGAPIKCP